MSAGVSVAWTVCAGQLTLALQRLHTRTSPERTMNSERQRRECEFQLLRYVPDAVRNEYVHIGVILREAAAEDQPGRAEVRFTRDWRRVRCLDPDADTALLEGMESELRRRLQRQSRAAS